MVVLEKLKSHNEAVYIAKKVIECLKLPFEIDSHTIHIGASVGISVYPTDGETPLIIAAKCRYCNVSRKTGRW